MIVVLISDLVGRDSLFKSVSIIRVAWWNLLFELLLLSLQYRKPHFQAALYNKTITATATYAILCICNSTPAYYLRSLPKYYLSMFTVVQRFIPLWLVLR